jgi:transcriptional regulator with XRE-family HTH domain
MTLGEKIRYLREVEGSLRGLNRPLTQQELMKGIPGETGRTISQSYLSQIERGKRPHMTQSSRTCWRAFLRCTPAFWSTTPRAITRNW